MTNARRWSMGSWAMARRTPLAVSAMTTVSAGPGSWLGRSNMAIESGSDGRARWSRRVSMARLRVMVSSQGAAAGVVGPGIAPGFGQRLLGDVLSEQVVADDAQRQPVDAGLEPLDECCGCRAVPETHPLEEGLVGQAGRTQAAVPHA